MRHRIRFAGTVLRLIFEWLFTILVAYFFIIIFLKATPYRYTALVLLGLYILSYITREYSPNNFVVLLIHAAAGVGLYFADIPRTTVWPLICIVVYMMSSSFAYTRTGKYSILNDMPWPTFFFSVIIYAYGYFSKNEFLTTRAYIIPVLLLVTYYLIIYIDGINVYVDSTKDVSGLPIKRIVKTNTMIVMLIIGLLIVGLILGEVLGLDDMLLRLIKAVLYLINLIFLGIRALIKLLAFFIGGDREQINEIRDMSIGEEARVIPAKAGEFFDSILKLLMALLAIYILYRVAAWFIRLLLRRRNVSGDIIEKADVRTGSFDSYSGRKKKGRGASAEDRIRAAYKEHILRFKYDIRLENNMTPEEISEELYDKEIADVSYITMIYSDVRYGGQKPTREMFKNMK